MIFRIQKEFKINFNKIRESIYTTIFYLGLDKGFPSYYTTGCRCKEKNFTGWFDMDCLFDQRLEKDKVEEMVHLSLLYDCYGELLSEQKKRILESYLMEDFSLSEIAKEAGISRQGVHDMIKRCTKQLFFYEGTLHLLEKFYKTKNQIEEIKKCAMQIKESNEKEAVDQILCITEELLQMI